VELSLQLQQKQVLSLKQQQSVAILQMNALALSEYAREMAEENPLLEWSEEGEPFQPRKEKLLQKMEWLEEADGANRGLYRMEHEADDERTESLKDGKGQTLREHLLFQINTRNIPEGHKAVLRFLAESIAESGYLEEDAIEMMMEKYPMKSQTAARILKEFQNTGRRL
jgi:RNA polymerase sigma-54 factor